MLVTYQPEGEPEQRWEFDPGRVRVSEAEMMQRRAGMPWEQFRGACMVGDAVAHKVLLWHLLRREHHTLRYEDVPDFLMAELRVERSRAELLKMREQVERSGKIEPQDKADMLKGLDMEIEQAPTLDSDEDADPEASAPAGATD